MRYDLDFKIKVIAYYKEGHSSSATGEKFGVNPRFVRKWIDPCRQIRIHKLGRF